MNQIGQLFTPKLWSKSRTPMPNKSCLENETTPEQSGGRCSWSAKILSKVKDCSNVIKDIMKLDKTPNTSNSCTKEQLLAASRENAASTPDIIMSNRISFGRSKEEPIVRYSKLNVDEGDSLKHRHSVSVGTFYTESNKSDSQSYTGQDQTSDSLRLFLELEKQVGSEFSQTEQYKTQYNTPNRQQRSGKKDASFGPNLLVDHSETSRGNLRDDSRGAGEMIPTRRKISAEPFLSRSQKSAELLWEEDSDESLPENVWNYLDLNTSEIIIDRPCKNSTFCEEEHARDSDRSGEVLADDSGFGNNNSILHETV